VRAVVVALIVFALVLPASSQQPNAVGRDNAGQVTTDEQRPDREATTHFAPGHVVDEDTYKTICHSPRNKEHADLCLQWRQAVAAENASFFAMISAALLLIALGLSVWAAGAAWQTVHTMRDTATRQLRAYVAIPKLRIRRVELGSKPVAVIKIKNSGQTPAYDLRGHFGLALFPYPFKDVGEPATPNEISVIDVGPNQAIVARAELIGPLEQKHIDALRDGRGAMLLVGHVTYRDAFGQTHRMDAKLRYTRQVFGSNKMEICPDGNKST
jgi:hypothetical protein